MKLSLDLSRNVFLYGRGYRDRTYAWRNQNPLPYLLANPQHNLVARARIELAIIAYQATVIPFNYPAKKLGGNDWI